MILSGLRILDTLEGPDYMDGYLSDEGSPPIPLCPRSRAKNKKTGSQLPVYLSTQPIGQRGAFRLN